MSVDTQTLTRNTASPPWRKLLRSDLLFSALVAAAFFLLMIATPNIPGGDDGYRHVKLASRLIRNPHHAIADPWRLLYFWPKPVDPWFGYELLLAPLTLVFSLIHAAKVLASLINGAIAFVLLAILQHFDVRYRKAWVVLAITGSGLTFYRATLTRPFLFSVLLVLVTAYFTVRKKPFAVGIASAVHAASYSIFFMVAFAPILNLLFRRDGRALKIALASLLGMAAGLICSPYFPEVLRFDLITAFGPMTLRLNHDLKSGMELLPINSEWLYPARVVLAVWVAALFRTVWVWRTQPISKDAQLFLGISFAALLASVRIGRTFDYFVPVAVLSAAVIISPWILKRRRNRMDAAAAATVLFVLCGLNVRDVYRAVKDSPPIDRFRGISQYLAAHEPGALVFNTQWEEYQFLYFWNAQNRYIVGIEPSFMFLRDPRRYWLWRHIANDETMTCDQPHCCSDNKTNISLTIAKDFGARLAVVEHNRNPLVEQLLLKDPLFKRVYADPACALFASTTMQSSLEQRR